MAEQSLKTLAQNKKARHNYFIDEVLETGIELFGTEVKSIRAGKVNLADAYASVEGGEVFVKQMNISPYEHGNIFNRDPLRNKKLLLHKKEIRRLIGLTAQDGYALIPLSLYLKGSRVKLSLGICRGKKLYDKRADIAARDTRRSMDRAFKEHNNKGR